MTTSTFLKLEVIISYQDKLIALADSVISGKPQDPERVTSIAVKIVELRKTLR